MDLIQDKQQKKSIAKLLEDILYNNDGLSKLIQN